MKLTPQQELEIYPILDAALDLPPGKGVLHKCTAKRADYLTRMVQGIRYDAAIESIEMYPPTHPLYGLGSYSCLWVEPHEQGLLATNLPSPPVNLMWQLIQCAANHNPTTLHGSTFNRARQRLVRAQKKYPQIMNAVYIVDEVPPIAKFGEVSPEEVLVVDIDRNPNSHLYGPTDEEVAKARMPMKNPPRFK